MVTLHNVIDTRTGQFYSIAVVSRRNAKWFVPVESDTELDEPDTTETE